PGDTEEDKDVIRRQLHHYIMAFDTGIAAAVGRQFTVAGESLAHDRWLFDLLMARSTAGDCELIARGWEANMLRGWLYHDGVFESDRRDEKALDPEALLGRYSQSSEPVTFTCVPPGDGRRNALDRNLDGILNGDDSFSGSDR
ncbi:MAG TPA: hypothetical protein VFX54_07885, partial [Candidatus Binatia bacterium]|nr:hypothetical protein [Candidatus Binatia bacterium]